MEERYGDEYNISSYKCINSQITILILIKNPSNSQLPPAPRIGEEPGEHLLHLGQHSDWLDLVGAVTNDMEFMKYVSSLRSTSLCAGRGLNSWVLFYPGTFKSLGYSLKEKRKVEKKNGSLLERGGEGGKECINQKI